MGTFYTACSGKNPVARARTARLSKLLVDTGSDYTWVPEATLDKIGISREKKDLEFIMANGKTITRSVGFAIIRLDEYFTIDEVVFAQPGDLRTDNSRRSTDFRLINTPLQRGDRAQRTARNRFNGFDMCEETVETVLKPSTAESTPLKRGVNERRESISTVSKDGLGLLGVRTLNGLNLTL